MTEDTRHLCVIAFSSDAFESAAGALRRMEGWYFDVTPYEGDPFTGDLRSVDVDDVTGEYFATFDRVREDGAKVGTARLNIFDDVERFEVC